MQFKVFTKGFARTKYEHAGDRVYPIYSQTDRTIVLDAETVEILNPKGDASSSRYLAFKSGKELVGLIKDAEWDFVIPADGEIIHNEHGENCDNR